MTGPPPDPEDGPDRLSSALADLAGVPAGDGRLARLRARALAVAERATT